MTIYPLTFQLGPLTITGYGLMMMVAFLMAGWAIQVDLRRRGMNEDYAADIVFAAVVGGIVGAKIWYVLLTGEWDALFRRGGFVWYGGFLGGVAAVLGLGWWRRVPGRWAMELTAAPLALGYALGRVGCFLVNDDYGIPSTLPWAMTFRGGQPGGKRHRPGQRGRDAVVVVDEETADAPQRVAERERRGGELHRPAPRHTPPPAEPEDRRHASEKPAVPHEPAAPKQRVPLPREQHVPDLRPDDPSDHGREHDIGGVVFVHAATPQIDLDCPAGHEERDHHHDAVAGDGERAKPEHQRVDGHRDCGFRIVDCGLSAGSRPGSGRSALASRVQSLRSPNARRCQPARAIMAALSVFRRGLATA